MFSRTVSRAFTGAGLALTLLLLACSPAFGLSFTGPANPAGPSPVPGLAVMSSPAAGTHVHGDVPIIGEADWPGAVAPWNFQQYTLEFGPGTNPASFTPFGSGAAAQDAPVQLGTWSTAGLPDGPYVLRLSSVNNTGNYVRAIVPVILDNSGAYAGPSFVVSAPVAQPRGSGPSAAIVNSSSYSDPASGWLHIVGEVQNNGNANLQYVEVTATFKDAAGHPLQTGIAFTGVPILVPGQTSSFDLFTRPPAGMAGSADLALTYAATATAPAAGLAISQDQAQIDNSGALHLMGTVTNSGPGTNTSFHVAYTIHDPSGVTVRAGTFNTLIGQNGAAFSLAPGTSGLFDFVVPNFTVAQPSDASGATATPAAGQPFGTYSLSIQ